MISPEELPERVQELNQLLSTIYLIARVAMVLVFVGLLSNVALHRMVRRLRDEIVVLESKLLENTTLLELHKGRITAGTESVKDAVKEVPEKVVEKIHVELGSVSDGSLPRPSLPPST